MDRLLVELMVIPEQAQTAATITLTRCERLELPEPIKKLAFVITTTNVDANRIVMDGGLERFEKVRITRLDGNPSKLEADQLASLFLESFQAEGLDKDHNALVCVGDINSVPLSVFSKLSMALNANAGGLCEQVIWGKDDRLLVRKRAYGGRMEVAIEHELGSVCLALRGGSPTAAQDPGSAHRLPVMTECFGSPVPTPYQIDATVDPGEHQGGLVTARLVIAGGRGMQSAEHYAVLGHVAQALGAALGGSLPAVDAGWIPVTRQIGQSGNYIKPDVYIAVGISGTAQHLAGVDPITRIVSINNDREAPLFLYSDVGVVADCHTFLPVLLNEIKRRSAAGAP